MWIQARDGLLNLDYVSEIRVEKTNDKFSDSNEFIYRFVVYFSSAKFAVLERGGEARCRYACDLLKGQMFAAGADIFAYSERMEEFRATPTDKKE